ncbi:MAG: hypothetical protein JO301_17020 [Chitinophagaceae bacterium]|nr:hypothetical protein [Chitinophagaceae bacterium]
MVEILYTAGKRNKKATLPENYNELSRRQVIAISRLFLVGYPPDVAQLEALRILLNRSLIGLYRIPLQAKSAMLEHVDWVFARNGLTRQFLPRYRRFYGPAGEWDNLTMGEWSNCEVYYEWMVNDRDENAINYLIAVLYRRRKKQYPVKLDPDGDLRVPYNHHETAYWAAKISRWPIAVKMGILNWYDGCREYVINSYDVFEPGTTEEEKKAPGMMEVIRGMCGATYGSFDQVEKMNVHKALREMEILKQEAAKLKADLKK